MNCLPHLTRRFLLACCLAAATCSTALAETNWNRFRGPNGLGVLDQSSVPLPWTDNDVAWTAKLPGKGHGSPIIQGENVYLLSADPDTAERYVLSFDLKSGKERWRKSYPSVTHKLHARSSYASSTPCADNDAVYVTWGAPDSTIVKAYSHAGDELWTRDLGRSVSQHGYGGSPMLAGDRLILLNSQDALELPPGVAPGQTMVVALDCKSGKTIWETPRETTRVCYGVPAIMQDASGRDLLIMAETGDGIFALDAQSGAPVWNRRTFTKRSVSSPLIVGDLIIGTEGSGGGGNVLFAVDAKRNHEVVFDVRKAAPYVPTPVAKGDLMFLWSDTGIVSCVQVPSGELLWSQRIGGNVSSSPIIVGDKLIGIADDGTVTILAADRSFKELGQIKLGETIRSTPAAREDCLLIRTESTLLRVGKVADSQ
ncbi:MAG: outer membrane protein assembly factor BamB family protein [Aureliella sp.]